MEKTTRNAIERATQEARQVLENDFAEQLEGTFDVRRNGDIATKPGAHLSPRQIFQREKIVAAIEHKRGAGMSSSRAVTDYLRDVSFTTLNRFVALKMLESRGLVQECITKGDLSSGYREFCGLATGVALLPERYGYRLYLESLLDELSTEIRVLFDRRDTSSALWPRYATFESVLKALNASELARAWLEDETIGWVYQYFNTDEERHAARYDERGKPKAPSDRRELAVRNQFFTPRYVVQFLADNTLGRLWYEMRRGETVLAKKCEYLLRRDDDSYTAREKKDPRVLLVLDPACGSGHFLLYAFDLLTAMYEEAFSDTESPPSRITGRKLAEDYGSVEALRRALPNLIVSLNLHGVDIDARCAQIAQLALWMRGQRFYQDVRLDRSDRSTIRRSNVVVAEPLVADSGAVTDFVAELADPELVRVFKELAGALDLAGDLGLLLRVDRLVGRRPVVDLLAPSSERIRSALVAFIARERSRGSTRRRLFVDDTSHALGLLAISETTFDVILMNPPFGIGSARAKKEFERAYPLTKDDVFSAFVQRGIELLASRGRLGAITSRTGFFLALHTV